MAEDTLAMADLMEQTKTRLAQTVRAQARLLELLHGERALAEQRLAVLENAITWETTCLGCSKHMDTLYELDLRNAQIHRALTYLDEVPAWDICGHVTQVRQYLTEDPPAVTHE